jgi:hypothetical protein
MEVKHRGWQHLLLQQQHGPKGSAVECTSAPIRPHPHPVQGMYMAAAHERKGLSASTTRTAARNTMPLCTSRLVSVPEVQAPSAAAQNPVGVAVLPVPRHLLHSHNVPTSPALTHVVAGFRVLGWC